VDDDIRQLDLLILTMEMSGFSVGTARRLLEGISLMKEPGFRKSEIAEIDYHIPVLKGCTPAAYLKARYPGLKVVLYSGALDISESERLSQDGLISTSDGIGALLSKITEFGQIDPASPTDDLCDHFGSRSVDSGRRDDDCTLMCGPALNSKGIWQESCLDCERRHGTSKWKSQT
jgi:hypothetical protein